VYKKRCEEKNIPVNHYTMPCPLWKEMQAQNAKKGEKQTTLDGVVTKLLKVSEFSHARVLHCVAQFVICDDQVGCFALRLRIEVE
jgi:hypothetical protein